MSLREDLAKLIKGDVVDDPASIKTYSRDTSIFERAPKIVVFPKDADDVSAIVQYCNTCTTRNKMAKTFQ
jgi:FAD/FMN-containing dehydrogenase